MKIYSSSDEDLVPVYGSDAAIERKGLADHWHSLSTRDKATSWVYVDNRTCFGSQFIIYYFPHL